MENFEFWNKTVTIIQALSKSLDKKWRKRQRKIDTFFLIIFITKLVFFKSKSGYQIIIDEIWDEFKKNGIDLPQEKSFAASSVCEARQKFSPEIIQEINHTIINEYLELNDKNFRSHGYRLFAVDGSKLILPSELRKEGYSLHKHMFDAMGILSCLYHIGTGIIFDSILDPIGNERHIAQKHFKKLKQGDVIIYDRGYFGYEFALEHFRNSINFIFRVDKGNVPKEIEDFINDETQPSQKIVTMLPSKYALLRSKNKNNKSILNSTIKLKLIRYKINDKSYYLATSLLESNISIDEFAIMYHKRWEIEEHYKLKKSILEIQYFHSKNELGVLQEIYCAALLINITRIFSVEANEFININNKDSVQKKILIESYVEKMILYLIKKKMPIKKQKKIK
jgi:hypothetical protein